jgi:transcriptional regulator with XRE-family HTH domain
MARSLHTAAHRELVSAVKALRNGAGLSQRELAGRLGREQNFVARVETGGRRIDLIELVAICAACEGDPAAEIAALVKRITPTNAGRRRGRRNPN